MATRASSVTPVVEKKDRVRKRADSTGEEENAPKRLRMTQEDEAAPSTSGSTASTSTRYDISSQDSSFTHVSLPLRIDLDKLSSRFTGPRTSSLSRRPSMASISRPQSPLMRATPSSNAFLSLEEDIIVPRADLRTRLVRSASSSSLRSMSPASSIISERVEPVFPPESARNHMRNLKFVVDYSQPTPTRPPQPEPPIPAHLASILPSPGFAPPPPPPEVHPRELPPSVRPQILACSATGILFFTRANRLHFKNLAANEEVGQVCKLQENYGSFSAVATSADVVAVGTSKGFIAIYDLQTKKRVMSWTTKPVSALAFGSSGVLTVGCVTGVIMHFDTKVTPVEKMKEQALAVTRHQASITRMEWNAAGELLATGDRKGNVYCWKTGEKVPLDIGEFVMRRKKVKHSGAISAVSWCPWQPRNLITADIKGVMHFWSVDPKNKDSNALSPAHFDTGSSITGLHWSSQCKEILTTHGYKLPESLASPPPPPPSASAGPLAAPCPTPPTPKVENTLAVWQFPSLKMVTTMKVNTTDVPIGNSVVFSKGQKLVFGVPEQGKIHACEVWGRKKPELKLRRHSSLDYVGCIR